MANTKSALLLLSILLLVNHGSSQGTGVRDMPGRLNNNGAVSSNKPADTRSTVNSPCYMHRDKIRKISQALPYSWEPNCDEKGFFAPKQCKLKYCWCSDPNGNMISGTMKHLDKGNVECGVKKSNKQCQIHYSKVMSSRKIPESVPRCDKDGYYSPRQCYFKYRQVCWCVDKYGEKTATLKIGEASCDAHKESNTLSGPTKRHLCLIERRKAIGISLSRKPVIPECRADGSFVPIQCNVYQGYCWCVDDKGQEIKGSRTERTPNCMSKHTDVKPCHLHKTYIYHLPNNGKIHVPTCKGSGLFQPVQCSRNKNVCWCVDLVGKEIEHTVIPRRLGAPHCPNGMTNVTNIAGATHPARASPCHRQRNKMKKVVYHRLFRKSGNIWIPTCDENGFFTATQCSSKYCWCSDRNGNMIARTIKSVLKRSNAECVTVRKSCVEERRIALMEPLQKKPFIPECRANGFYSPIQCNTYEGTCWCTDKNGKEIARSKTKRTPNCFSNVLNEIGEGPCSLLKSHIARMPGSSKIYQPKCDDNGFFQPAQCSKTGTRKTGTVKYCWCVMPDGTEMMGSLRLGAPNCDSSERRAPAVPKIRGPCEEHIFRLINLVSKRNVYTPVCDYKGFFLPNQCNNHTGFCWCADLYGSPIEGTKTLGVPNCDVKTLTPCTSFKQKPDAFNKGYKPVCTNDGYFAPLQCNVNTGKCWCVDKLGMGIPGTNIYERPYCGIENRICENKRRSLLSSEQGKTEEMLPSCDVHGYYSYIQCNHALGECLCTDRHGEKNSGTKTKEIPECGQIPRPCDEHASRSSDYDFVFGVYVPQCDLKGYYKIIQCHELTNTCWCSNRVGVEIPGTKTIGEPKCTM